MKKYTSIIISTVSLVLSITAVCVACWRSSELSFDYQGVLVGVLSLLVTVLIGWNIYSLIDISKTKGELNSIANSTSRMIFSNMTVLESANMMIYHYLLLKSDPAGLEYRFVNHGLSAILYCSQIEDTKTCNVLVKIMLECVVYPEKIYFTDKGKRDIFKLISLVKGGDSIEGFLELVERLSRVKVRGSRNCM